MGLPELTAAAAATFRTLYGRPPLWLVAAPGRVNLIGEHTDYNDGLVLPLAIDRHTVIAAGPAALPLDGCRVHSLALDASGRFFLDRPPARGEPTWLAYLRGVCTILGERGFPVPVFEAVIHSDLPVGGGLSSSAALTMAMTTLLAAAAGVDLPPLERARLCQDVEHRFAGVPCGLMDPWASAAGRADQLLFLDCRSHRLQYVPFTSPDVAIMVLDSGVHHQLASGEYGKRRADCQAAAKLLGLLSLRDASPADLNERQAALGERLFRRARHVVSENRRVEQFLTAVADNDWQEAGELMNASHDSLQTDYEVSCRELDVLVAAARDIGVDGGVWGARMTGGGFGGCTVSLIDPRRFEAIRTALAYRYYAATGIQPRAFVTRPVAGARILSA